MATGRELCRPYATRWKSGAAAKTNVTTWNKFKELRYKPENVRKADEEVWVKALKEVAWR